MKCQLCKREFNNITSLITHLTHPKSKCKIPIKDYYDQFFRKENEGVCPFCGRETAFSGIIKGYQSQTCNHCTNKNQHVQKKRSLGIAQKRKEKRKQKKIKTGYYDFSEVCEICKKNNLDNRFKTRQGLSKHISQKHDISMKTYYDKYFKTKDEGICLITGKKTRFKNLVCGYYKYSGKGTCSSDKQIQKEKEKTLLKNYGVLNPIDVNKQQGIKKRQKIFKDKRDLKQARNNIINFLRMLTIDPKNKLQCQLCGKTFLEYLSVSGHLRIHNVSAKQYYDMFFKKNKEGICSFSNLPTTFNSLKRGYYKYHPSIITLIPEIKNGSKKSQLRYIKNKIKEEQSKYLVEIVDIENINTIHELVDYKCTKCNTVFKTRFTYLRMRIGLCPKCKKPKIVSDQEIELHQFIKSIQSNVHFSRRNIIKNPATGYPLELDVYIPAKKIAFEYNGIYWHSECIQKDPQHCHIIKTTECEKLGIQLFHIFEDEWIHKKEIVHSMIKYKLNNIKKRIYARHCTIQEISPSEKNKFLEKNHIQGADKSQIKLGAFYNDELASVMTFSCGNISKGGNPNQTEDWELVRFATKIDYQIVGVASKLLSYFEKLVTWNIIYSFADLRWSNGNLYYKLGFELIKQSFPNYWYVDDKNTKRIHRFSLRKRPDEPKDIPEWLLRHQEGYYRIWDCGNLKFVKANKNAK